MDSRDERSGDFEPCESEALKLCTDKRSAEGFEGMSPLKTLIMVVSLNFHCNKCNPLQ